MDHSTDKETLIQSAIRRFSLALRPLSGNKVAHRESKEVPDHLICKPEDNPNYILKACARGQTDVVNYIILKDPTKISAKDTHGWTCMHHAASSNKVQLIDILLSRGADINAQDLEGNTPLHLAAARGYQDTVRHLLTKKADATILNKKNMGAIHVAVHENQPHIISEMRKFPDQVDFCLIGYKGCVALHMAAKFDFDECAKELIKNGGTLCLPTTLGLTPLHVAAKYGSSNTMEVILRHGETLGLSRQTLLTKGDKEGNSPLHTSVSSGDLKAVRVCLEHGSEIDFCLENKSTPLHFACSQGILPIVKLMYETHVKRRGIEEAREVLSMKDKTLMTPLHRAALFDHAPVVEYLILQGSNVNELDIDKRTPLLLAAFKKSIKSIGVLLEAGADIEAKDVHRRNLLHYLVAKQIIGTCRIVDDGMKKIWQSSFGSKLVNEKDLKGCSPLHYSSKDGNLKFTEDLINLGATINLKNNEDQSPLHFASQFGRYKTARRLLESQIGLHIINEIDHDGMTALHLASANGRTKVVQMLCEKGALIHKNYIGQCPAHLASRNGFKDTLNILLSFHPNLIDEGCYRNHTALHVAAAANKGAVVELLLNLGAKNIENDEGKKPLDMAIENGCIEAALVFVMHDRWIEFLTATSNLYICPLKGFIQLMPEVYKVVLDRCHIRAANIDEQSPDYWEKFNFALIQPNVEGLLRDQYPLCAQNMMVKYGRVELLHHPVCLHYLKMKWCAYGFPIFFVNFTLYAAFVSLLTSVLIQNQHSFMERADVKYQQYEFALETNLTNQTTYAEPKMLCLVNVYFLLVFLAINLMKEVIEIVQQKISYAFDFNNYTEWLLYITTTVYIVPIVMMNPEHFESIQSQCGSIAIFLAWFNLLIHLEKVESVGIFIIMFQRILKTILKVILIFSVLFIAFALAFFVLMQNDIQGGFHSPFLSFVHVIMLMMGDWNFVDLYQKPYLEFPNSGILKHAELNFFFLILFVILIPILFINLLIGLAVGDIEIVRNDAILKKLAMQVEYHTKLEMKLPSKFLARVDKDEITMYPNRIVQEAGVCSNILDKVRVIFFGTNMPTCSNRGYGGLKPDRVNGKDSESSDHSKRKFSEMQNQLNQITDLLRMVVQKMDIGQETDHNDINL